METYFYYSIRNTVNNKCYCGITINPHNRQLKHWRELRNNCHHSIRLQNAVNKYGLENFVFEIEEEHRYEYIDEAYAHEMEFIAKHNSYLDGYNMTPGGLGSKSIESYEHTKQSWWQRVDSICQIDKETFELIAIYPSLRELERQKGYAHSNISKVCTRKSVNMYGYYWCYLKDWSDHWIPPINNKYRPIGLLDKDTREIVQVYQSCAEAGRKLKLDRANIRASILRNGCCGEYKFRYITIEEYELYACRD